MNRQDGLEWLRRTDISADDRVSGWICRCWHEQGRGCLTREILRKFMVACVIDLSPYCPNPNLIWSEHNWENATEEKLAWYHADLLRKHFEFPEFLDEKDSKELQLCLFASAEPYHSVASVSILHAELTPMYNEMDKDMGIIYRGYDFQVEKLIELVEQETKE